MNEKIEFISEGHLYLYCGMIIPSVSDILKFIFPNKYSDIPAYILQNKAEYGTKVHELIEILDNMQISELEAFKEELEAYKVDYITEASLEQYLKLKKENNFKTISQEKMVCYNGIYAGRYDKEILINNELCLADIKTTATFDEEYLSWQLSLYKLASNKEYKKLYAIWLPKKQLGKLIEVKEKSKEELLDKLKEFIDCRNNE